MVTDTIVKLDEAKIKRLIREGEVCCCCLDPFTDHRDARLLPMDELCCTVCLWTARTHHQRWQERTDPFSPRAA